jgi:5-methylthioadenosine/S-adenosylhomocysteine deaminase
VSPVADLLLRGVTAVTLDRERRVLEGAWISVSGDRITDIGTGEAPLARKVIEGPDLVAIPGLIDAHSHAGHGLVRAAGGGDDAKWFAICQAIYSRHAPAAFWRAEARLTQLERLMSGVTTAVSLLGGGGDVMRTEATEAGDAHCAATVESGLRTIMAVGPSRGPFPKAYNRFDTDGQARPVALDFETQLAVSADLIERWNDVLDRRTGVCLVFPVYRDDQMTDPSDAAKIRAMTEAVKDLRARTGVLLTQDGHRGGTIALAQKMGLLGNFALLSHCIDLTEADMAALRETSASVAHNPSAIMSIFGRCPAPELIAQGVNVCISSDASAPDRGYDMFRHMAQCMHYHRRHFRDAGVLPEGKVLAMTTIDAARALRLDRDLGSLEVGKKADFVLMDMHKPHLCPPVMPVTRLTHFAGAADVDTVIVNGKVLMERRQVLHLDSEDILADAAAQAALAFERAGVADQRVENSSIWGR